MKQKLSASQYYSAYSSIDPTIYVESTLKRNLMDEVATLIYEKNRPPIVFTPVLVTERLEDVGAVREHSLEFSYAQTVEIYTPSPPPSFTIFPSMTWKQRLKFLFTNKYPKQWTIR